MEGSGEIGIWIGGCSHITSAGRGGGVWQMLTIADGGGRGGPDTPDFGWRNMWTAPNIHLWTSSLTIWCKELEAELRKTRKKQVWTQRKKPWSVLRGRSSWDKKKSAACEKFLPMLADSFLELSAVKYYWHDLWRRTKPASTGFGSFLETQSRRRLENDKCCRSN